MNKKNYFLIAFLTLLILPAVSYANNGLADFLISFQGTLNKIIVIVASLGVLAFFWGMVKLAFNAGDVKKQEEGRNVIKYGLIVLFVMFSIWGIVRFIQQGFGLNSELGPILNNSSTR